MKILKLLILLAVIYLGIVGILYLFGVCGTYINFMPGIIMPGEEIRTDWQSIFYAYKLCPFTQPVY